MLLKAIIILIFISTIFPTKIKNLNYNNPVIQQLRKEVATNLKKTKKGSPIKVRWRYYKIIKNDNFFKVMAKTMLDHDTLATVNRLSSLWDVEPGKVWLIPNVRGAAILRKKANSLTKGVSIPGHPDFIFIPGYKKNMNEREYLTLKTFIFPVKGSITSEYGLRKHPIYGKKHWHKGIDIKVPIGTNVKAAAAGSVILTQTKKGYGKTILIQHKNDRTSLYAHLSKFKVKKGAKVRQGQIIGVSGKTGNVTGPHLHFEIRRNGKPIRPNHLLNKL